MHSATVRLCDTEFLILVVVCVFMPKFQQQFVQVSSEVQDMQSLEQLLLPHAASTSTANIITITNYSTLIINILYKKPF